MHAYATDSRTQVYAGLASFAVAVAVLANKAVDATGFGYGWLIGAPSMGGAFVMLLSAFNSYAWRWRWLRKVGVELPPVIVGTYEGTLRSSYNNTERQARLQVEQRWLGILIRLELPGSDTSTSRSITAALYNEGEHDARLTYTYTNSARPARADGDMSDHDGTAEVTVYRDGRLEGRYFNFRTRRGELKLHRANE